MLKKINKKEYILLAMVSLLALMIRIILFNNINGDMKHFLIPWIEQINKLGKIKSLKYTIGDYNTPYIFILTMLTYFPINNQMHYVYAIKLISVLFDYILAIASMVLIFKLTKNKLKAILGYIFVLFMPTIITNSAMWGQCDSIYTTFVVLSLVFLVDNKSKLSMVLLAVAFSFKLQTILIMPLYGYIIFSRSEVKITWKDVVFFIITFFAMGLPSVLMGKSIVDTYNTYLLQAGQHNDLFTLSYYNYYTLISKNRDTHVKFLVNNILTNSGIIILFLTFISSYIFVFYKKLKISKKSIIEIGLWCVIITTFFLPRMHERYAYMADALSIVYVMIFGKKRIIVPILAQIVSLAGYVNSCFYLYIPSIYKIAAILNLVNLIYITVMLYKDVFLFNKEKTRDKDCNDTIL